MRLLHVVLVLSFSILVGCTKKRPVMFSQGQGRETEKISTYADTCGDLKTSGIKKDVNKGEVQAHVSGSQIFDAKGSTKQNLRIESKNNLGVNYFTYVNYATKMDLLGKDLLFRGRENFTYKICYRLSPNWLKVVKIGARKDIPFSEAPSGKVLKSGPTPEEDTLEIPLMGYRVTYFSREKQVNADNEKTNIVIELPQTDPSKAKYVKVDKLSRELYTSLTKVDVLPKTFFEGDWFYGETIIDTSDEEYGSRGNNLTFDSTYNLANKIRFLPIHTGKGSYLRAVNLQVDPRLDVKKLNAEQLDYVTAFSLDINPVQYRSIRLGNNDIQMREEEDDTIEPAKRDYYKVSFESVETPSQIFNSLISSYFSFEGWMNSNILQGKKRLVDMQVSDRYFSFTVQNDATKRRIRLSFLRTDAYQERTPKNIAFTSKKYFKDDKKSYGFYATQPVMIRTGALYRQEDLDKNSFLFRFNHKKSVITYHLSDATPDDQWLYDVAQDAFSIWNAALTEANAGIRLKLQMNGSKPARADLGDIRYNVINFVESLTGDGSGGLGPWITDAQTGEIVSATANIYLQTYREVYLGYIRQYILDETGIYAGTPFYSTMVQSATPSFVGLEYKAPYTNNIVQNKSALGDFSIQSADFLKPESEFNKLLRPGSTLVTNNAQQTIEDKILYKKIADLDGKGEVANPNDALIRLSDLRKTPIGSTLQYTLPHASGPVGIGLNEMKEAIEKSCPEVVAFAKSLKARKDAGETALKIDTNTEVALSNACFRVIGKTEVTGVLVHELGHNLGLAHNFAGSSDGPHLFTKDTFNRIYGGINNGQFIANEDKDVLATASVMDYVPSTVNSAFPGAYDIAALRYSYTSQVENAEGNLQHFDADKSLVDQGIKAKKYKYCDDMDVMLSEDPLCMRFDAGGDTLQVTKYLISQFRALILSRNFRYDRVRTPNKDAFFYAKIERYYLPLKRIYDEWRMRLADFAAHDPYLVKYSAQSYAVNAEDEEASLLEQMRDDKNYGAYFAEYYQPSREIYNFLKEVISYPNYYCVGISNNQLVKVVEFERILNFYSPTKVGENLHSTTAMKSCSDPLAQQYLKDKLDVSYLGEFGMPYHNISYQFDRYNDQTEDSIDVIGIQDDKFIADWVLASRWPTNILTWRRGFYPNFLDEPDLKVDFEDTLRKRVLTGVDLAKEMAKIKTNGFNSEESLKANLLNNEYQFPLYEQEQPIIQYTYLSLFQSQWVPGKLFDTSARLKDYTIRISDKDQYDYFKRFADREAGYERPNKWIIYPEKESSKSKEMVQKMISTLEGLKVLEVDQKYVTNLTNYISFLLKKKNIADGKNELLVGTFAKFFDEDVKEKILKDKALVARPDAVGIFSSIKTIFGPEMLFYGSLSIQKEEFKAKVSGQFDLAKSLKDERDGKTAESNPVPKGEKDYLNELKAIEDLVNVNMYEDEKYKQLLEKEKLGPLTPEELVQARLPKQLKIIEDSKYTSRDFEALKNIIDNVLLTYAPY